MTFHSLRRTYASPMAEYGADAALTMAQIGHRTAAMTLGVYTDVGNWRHDAIDRLGSLLEAPETAQDGTRTDDGRADNPTGAGDTTPQPQHSRA